MRIETSKRVFELSVEVKPLPGSAMPRELIGAFVYCYVTADNIEDSIDIVKDALQEDCYELVDIEYCARIDLAQWKPEDDNFPTAKQLEELEFGELRYSPFYGYQSVYEH